jgi:hypothetical protein
MKAIDTDALGHAVRVTLQGEGLTEVCVTTPDPLEELALDDFRQRVELAGGDVAAMEMPATTLSIWYS